MHDVLVALQGLKQVTLARQDDAGDVQAGMQSLRLSMDVGQGGAQTLVGASGDAAVVDQAVQTRRRLLIDLTGSEVEGCMSQGALAHAYIAGFVAVELNADGGEGVLDRAQGAGVGVHRSANTFQSLDGLQAEAGESSQFGLLDARQGPGGANLFARER